MKYPLPLRILSFALSCLLVGGALWVFASVVTWAQAQAEQSKAPKVSIYAAQGAIPEVVTIRLTLPDTARVCVEQPDNQPVACRPVYELRKWVRQGAQSLK